MDDKSAMWEGLQWRVTKNGLESKDGELIISMSELISFKSGITPETMARWPIEMAVRFGINLDDFITAWLVALAFNSFDQQGQEQLIEGIKIAKDKRAQFRK